MRLPTFTVDGVPLCSEEHCPLYDGKRCSEIGFRPGRICEPEVMEMAEELRALRQQVGGTEPAG